MSGQFIQRLLTQLINNVLVKGLAESKTFQRFAVRTQSHVEEARKFGNEFVDQTAKSASASAASATATTASKTINKKSVPPQPPLRGIPGFFMALGKEIRKDLKM
mmetsp:Transcript_796/g.963  ORF Transcript_796/g.963 Transcript_796/m.963 type:complete len:105 (-) Transcript_796:251-565(-)